MTGRWQMARWPLVAALGWLAGCAEQPLDPGARGAYTALAAVTQVADTVIVNLDVGLALGILAGGTERVPFDADASAVNDSGWVFMADPLRKRGLVWLDDENGAYPVDALHLKPLPTDLRWLGGGTNTDPYNGRGDYIALRSNGSTVDSLVMADGAGGWVQGGALLPPAGFVDTAYAWGINDDRLVVGHAKNPARTWKSKYTTHALESPVAWTVNALGQVLTVTALPIPAASTGCLVGNVRAYAVNDNGVIVGYSQENSIKTGAYCPRQAVLWPSATSTPILLPRTTEIPGFPPKPKSNELLWLAMHVNNAGVVAGRVAYRGDNSSVVRWRKIPGTEAYGPPEFNGFWSFPAALDECGRVAVDRFGSDSYTGVWGEGPTDVPVRLPVPEGFIYPSGAIWDLVSHPRAGDLVVGDGGDPLMGLYLGDRVLLWKLPACRQ